MAARVTPEVPVNEHFNHAQEPSYLDNIEFWFGVEIEICIRIQEGCLEGILPTEEFFSEFSFTNKFQIYLNSILSKASSTLKQRFPEIAMKDDDSTFFIYNILENKIIPVESESEQRKIESYEIPRFEMDISVRCGDTLDSDSKIIDRNTGSLIEPWKSIAIECISPIFKIRGIPTSEKIRLVLLPYLEFIGLMKQECFMTNSSAGYHVNLSAFNLQTQQIIPLTRFPLLLFVLDEYIKKEREYYSSEFRGDPSGFAKPLYVMTNLLLKKRPNLRNNKQAFFQALTDPEHIVRFKAGENNNRSIFPRNSWITRKKFGIKVKPSEILEFRVFKSDKHIDAMIDNVHYSMIIVMNAILHFWTKRDPRGLANLSDLFPEVGGKYKKTKKNKRKTTRKAK
jgi:hypothetical protein